MATTTKKITTKAKADTKETAVKEAAKSTIKADEKDAIIEELKKQMKEMAEELKKMKEGQTTVVSAEIPKVYFLWQAEVSDDNIVLFGENGRYGRIVGKTGTFFVPKNELSMIMDSQCRTFLDNRWLIAVDGLTQEEREAMNLDYKEGELLDRKAFAKIAEMGEEIFDIFPKLCDSHKEMVVKRLYETWQNKSAEIKRETIIGLYKIYPDEALKRIKEGLDAQEME